MVTILFLSSPSNFNALQKAHKYIVEEKHAKNKIPEFSVYFYIFFFGPFYFPNKNMYVGIPFGAHTALDFA